MICCKAAKWTCGIVTFFALVGAVVSALAITHVLSFASAQTYQRADVSVFQGFHAGEAKIMSEKPIAFEPSSPAQPWQNPWKPSENPIDIPIGMTRINIGSITDSMSSAYAKSISDYESMQASSWGISGSLPGMFSGGAQAEQVRKQTLGEKDAQYFMESRLTYELYRDTLDSSSWSPTFINAIQRLPSSLNSTANRDRYFEFFNSFGTHFVSSVSWGGSKWASYSLSQSLVETGQISESNLKIFITAKFEKILKIAEGSARWDSNTTSQFSKFEQYAKTMSATETIGGDVTLDDYKLWLKSVIESPMIIGQKLSPYHIAVQKLDPVRGGNLAMALKEYFLACQSDDGHNVCAGHGVCQFYELADPKTCICDFGYIGDACNMQDGQFFLYPSPLTKTKVLVKEQFPNKGGRTPETSLFYVGLVPSLSIAPARMQGWKTKTFNVTFTHRHPCMEMIVSRCWVAVGLTLIITYDGKMHGSNTTYLQLAANSQVMYEPGKENNFIVESDLLFKEMFPFRGGIAVNLQLNILTAYCGDGSYACARQEHAAHIFRVTSLGEAVVDP